MGPPLAYARGTVPAPQCYLARFRLVCNCVYGKVARSSVRYGERERPEHRSIGLLTDAQVAHAISYPTSLCAGGAADISRWWSASVTTGNAATGARALEGRRTRIGSCYAPQSGAPAGTQNRLCPTPVVTLALHHRLISIVPPGRKCIA